MRLSCSGGKWQVDGLIKWGEYRKVNWAICLAWFPLSAAPSPHNCSHLNLSLRSPLSPASKSVVHKVWPQLGAPAAFRNLLDRLQTANFSLCPPKVRGAREVGWTSYKSSNLIHEGSSHDIIPSKSPPSNTINLGFQQMNLVGTQTTGAPVFCSGNMLEIPVEQFKIPMPRIIIRTNKYKWGKKAGICIFIPLPKDSQAQPLQESQCGSQCGWSQTRQAALPRTGDWSPCIC